jgi:hypothetical protein
MVTVHWDDEIYDQRGLHAMLAGDYYDSLGANKAIFVRAHVNEPLTSSTVSSARAAPSAFTSPPQPTFWA